LGQGAVVALDVGRELNAAALPLQPGVLYSQSPGEAISESLDCLFILDRCRIFVFVIPSSPS